MNTKIRMASAVVAICAIAAALFGRASTQRASDRALANALANDATQQAAIASIVTSEPRKVLLLLSWTQKPPNDIPGCALYGGLAQAFGELKTKEAIPFLIKYISLYRSCGVSLGPWLKAPEIIEWNLPAVGALVKIGPDASKAVIAAFRSMPDEDRLPAIFVVSQVKGVPESRVFLESVLGRTNGERRWAQEGLSGAPQW
jgi:hypothetical protein